MLEEHLELLEQAKLRDHRKLGKELELFTFSQRVGPGLASLAAQRCPAEGTPGKFSEKGSARTWL